MDGTIEIICPLYNAENYIINLNKSFNMQEKANLKKVTYLLTESEDKSEQILKENNLNYEIIKKEEFSHSVTRENAAMKSKEDIIVFVSQDVVIENKDWLFELTKDITDDDIKYLVGSCSKTTKGKITNNQFNECYLITKDIDISKVKLQEEEVAEIKFFTKEEVLERINNNYDGLTDKTGPWNFLLKILEQR